MIKVTILNKYSIEITGHSMPDICASVSTLTQHTYNTIQYINEGHIDYDDNGDILKMKLNNKATNIDKKIFEVMVYDLYSLEEHIEIIDKKETYK